MPFEVLLLDEARAFIDRLPVKLKAKTLRTVELLVRFGPDLPMPLTSNSSFSLRRSYERHKVREISR